MAIPKLLTVQKFAEPLEMEVKQAYEFIKTLPPGVVVRLGHRVRINEDAFNAWLAAGGHS